MVRPRQPIELVQAKGKKHLTKAEIETRKKQEVKAPKDKVKAPKFLTRAQKLEFKKLSDQLIELDIFSNLDVDSLARYITSRDQWLFYTEQINQLMENKEITSELEYKSTKLLKEEMDKDVNERDMNVIVSLSQIRDQEIERAEGHFDTIEQLSRLQDKSFKQARLSATDHGLTISSRCKLIIPETNEPPKENKFSKFAK